ncbi:CD225/dispanin family protein [Rhodococcus marinonascens]|uniref:CD225/dispanin family protein n=1 Tax=Rhodococcus marinonascens TaxID=38311 RepID=UPI0009354D62|nr:CD225/dispanin family protein [Rhodococcus marinonascens]
MSEPTSNPEWSSDPGTPIPGDTGSYGLQYQTQQQPPQQLYPGQFGPPPLPRSNAGWAAAAVIFFWPLAFSAFNHVHDVYPKWAMGDYQGAQYASDQAKSLGKIALWIFVALMILFVLFYVIMIAVVVASTSSSTM